MNRKNLNVICREFFQVSLICYLFLILLETIREGYITYYFNLNVLLAIVLVCGLGLVVTDIRLDSGVFYRRGGRVEHEGAYKWENTQAIGRRRVTKTIRK